MINIRRFETNVCVLLRSETPFSRIWNVGSLGSQTTPSEMKGKKSTYRCSVEGVFFVIATRKENTEGDLKDN